MSLDKFAAEILREAADTIEKRSGEYGGAGSMFDDVARLAEVNPRTAFDVFIAMKQVRLAYNPEHHDSLVDLVAYFALKSCYGKLGAGEVKRYK